MGEPCVDHAFAGNISADINFIPGLDVRSIGDVFAHPDLKQKAIEDVRKAGESVQTIRGLFETVKYDLEAMHCAGIKLRTSARRYMKRWDTHTEKFETLLRSSRIDAMRASSLLQTYLILLRTANPNSQQSLQDLSVELGSFMKSLDKEGKNAQKLAEKFRKLARKIGEFRRDINSEFAHLQRVPKALEQARSHLDTLQSSMAPGKDNERTETWALILSIIMRLAMVAGQAALAILSMSPMAVAPAVVGAIDVLKVVADALIERKRRLVTAEDVAECERQIQELVEQQRLLSEHAQILSGTNTRITTIISNVYTLSHFWENLRVDVIKLQEALRMAVNHRYTITYFRPKMDAALHIYDTLVVLYEEYSKIPL